MTESFAFKGSEFNKGPELSGSETKVPVFDNPASVNSQGEILTWILGFIVYSSWLLVTVNFHQMPIWAAFIFGGLIVCWHGSFQHEAIHGHPTRSELINSLVACIPLGLLYPYMIYKSSHLEHHATDRLTNPMEDPESFYLTEEQWRKASSLKKGLLTFNNSLAGRLLIGPAICFYLLTSSEFKKLYRRDFSNLKAWLFHLPLVAIVLYWVLVVCQISFIEYVICFAYPGLSLTLLRSFTEHRPGKDNQEQSAIVDASILFQVLFLNNNFHYVHHARPWLPWYRIKDMYRERKEDILRSNGNFQFDGYSEIAKRYWIKSKDSPVHPGS